MPESIRLNTAKEYRLKYGMQMPTLTLARVMYKENIGLFTSIDDARNTLRYNEGKSGKYQKRMAKDKSLYMNEERPRNPWNLPQSEETIYEPFIIKAKKLAVLSDIHIPYHSVAALSAGLDFIQAEKPDAILLNGDTIDMYSLSRFQKDPRKRSVAHELQATRDFLDVLSQFGAKIRMRSDGHYND